MNLKNKITGELHKVVEAEQKKVVMNLKQYQDSADELPDDTVVKIVDETEVNEKSVSRKQQQFMGLVHKCKTTGDCPSKSIRDAANSMSGSDVKDFASTKHKGLPQKIKEINTNQNDPKVEKLVGVINKMITDAIDSDGDPIGVIDTSGTWEEPMIYSPIIYKNGVLKISSRSVYDTSGKPNTEVILKRNMEFDGIPTLLNIKKQYVKALKKKNNGLTEENLETIPVDQVKLKSDVQKFMDKLNLGQFEALFAKIDKPIEQAEIIAAFGERIGIPRTKLPMILQSLKSVSENVNPRMKKSDLVEHILKTKK